MSEFYQYAWIRYKGKPYYARIVNCMYGSYYEIICDDNDWHRNRTIRQQEAVKLEPPKFKKGQMVYYIGDECPFTNVMVEILDNEGLLQYMYRIRYGVYIRAWSLKNLEPFKHPHYALFVIQENQIQGFLKTRDVQVGQIVMYYGQPSTIVELPNIVSWAYIIDVNGQKVVTTIFQLEDIDY